MHMRMIVAGPLVKSEHYGSKSNSKNYTRSSCDKNLSLCFFVHPYPPVSLQVLK